MEGGVNAKTQPFAKVVDDAKLEIVNIPLPGEKEVKGNVYLTTYSFSIISICTFSKVKISGYNRMVLIVRGAIVFILYLCNK